MLSYIYDNNKKKIISGLDKFITDLIETNEKLRNKLANFNKDDQIQGIKNELSDVRKLSVHVMSEKEYTDASVFSEEHYKSCKGNIRYIIQAAGGIGTSVWVKCDKCNMEKNITDIDNW